MEHGRFPHLRHPTRLLDGDALSPCSNSHLLQAPRCVLSWPKQCKTWCVTQPCCLAAWHLHGLLLSPRSLHARKPLSDMNATVSCRALCECVAEHSHQTEPSWSWGECYCGHGLTVRVSVEWVIVQTTVFCVSHVPDCRDFMGGVTLLCVGPIGNRLA